MDKYLIVLLVFIFCVILVIYTQKGESKSKEPKSLRGKVLRAFPAFNVVEKFNTIVIYGLNERQEEEEFVTIRIDEHQQKNIRLYGRMMIVTYSKEPSERELKKDLSQHLMQT